MVAFRKQLHATGGPLPVAEVAAGSSANRRTEDPTSLPEQQLSALKEQLDALKREQQFQPPPQPRHPATVGEYIDQMPGVTERERAWLKKNPQTLTDARLARRLAVIHDDALLDEGLQRDSDQYFAYVEKRLGLTPAEPPPEIVKQHPAEREPEPQVVEEPEPAPALARRPIFDAPPINQPEARRIPVAAPPSRDTVSASGNRGFSTKIVLTPEQREAARFANISEVDYAKGLLELRSRKVTDPERYR